VLSHGVWEGVADWDAPTQLVLGARPVTFYRGPIPKGVYYPMCGMNLAFARKLLPWMYFAPMGPRMGLDRFADIWCGIESKRAIDAHGWAVVSGYATVYHSRASNVWANLQKEAKGLPLNEGFWQGECDDPYFACYAGQYAAWQEAIQCLL
jgi:reversibly glycosylated polypeptide/UDP-arabinopyranose mutase